MAGISFIPCFIANNNLCLPSSTTFCSESGYCDNITLPSSNGHSFVVKNLSKKKAKGEYDSKLAVKGFMYLVDDGAKKYTTSGRYSMSWNVLFPKNDRLLIAKQYVDRFEAGEFEE